MAHHNGSSAYSLRCSIPRATSTFAPAAYLASRRRVQNEWPAVACNTPNCREQLSHHCNKCHFARLSLRNQMAIVSLQPRIESHGCQNRHPERLAQSRVPETNHGGSRGSSFAGLPQARSDAHIVGQCCRAMKARGIASFRDEVGRRLRTPLIVVFLHRVKKVLERSYSLT